MIQLIYFLILGTIFLLGLLTSYTDIRKGKIPNNLVFPAIFLGIVLNPFLQGFNFNDFLFNGFAALVLAFVLYLAEMWSAADGKLFLAFAVLIPTTTYLNGVIQFFPSFTILINTFFPLFFFLLAKVLLKTTWPQKILCLHKAFNQKTVAELAVIIFAFTGILNWFFAFTKLETNFFLSLVLLFILIEALRIILKVNLFKASIVLCIIRFVLEFNSLIQINFWTGFILFLVSFLLLRLFVLYLGKEAFGKNVNADNLKEGMILLDGVVEKEGKYVLSELFVPTFLNLLIETRKEYAVNLGSAGLSKEDVTNLENWRKQGKLGFSSIHVQDSVAFAPYLFLGVVLTLLAKGNLVIYLLSLIT